MPHFSAKPQASLLRAEAAYHFSAQTNDWGFTQFAAQQDAYSPKEGFLVNDTLHFNVVVRIDRQEDYNYDSKKATGYVGLKNQGATCYMNSLLQTLYNINYFRQVFTSRTHAHAKQRVTPDVTEGSVFCVLLASSLLCLFSPNQDSIVLGTQPLLYQSQRVYSVRTLSCDVHAGCISHAYSGLGSACQQCPSGAPKHLLQGDSLPATVTTSHHHSVLGYDTEWLLCKHSTPHRSRQHRIAGYRCSQCSPEAKSNTACPHHNFLMSHSS